MRSLDPPSKIDKYNACVPQYVPVTVQVRTDYIQFILPLAWLATMKH